jgi:hypothetical protein
MNYSADIKKLPRHFLAKDFVITDWIRSSPILRIWMKGLSVPLQNLNSG